jgi:hypothetical protein
VGEKALPFHSARAVSTDISVKLFFAAWTASRTYAAEAGGKFSRKKPHFK